MKKSFTEEENSEIYFACNAVRSLITVNSAIYGLKNIGQGLINVAQKTGKGSRIIELVQSRDWENLFQDEEWLNVLEMAVNLNSLQNDQYKKYLTTIAKFFPEETEGYIIPEFL